MSFSILPEKGSGLLTALYLGVPPPRRVHADMQTCECEKRAKGYFR